MQDGSTRLKPDGAAPPGVKSPFHAMDDSAVIALVGAVPATGLSSDEAAARLDRLGGNRTSAMEDTPWWRTALRQMRGAVVWLLVGATVLSIAIGDLVEAAAIVVVLIVNATIGYTTERRATKSMAALRRMTRIPARVRRGGVDILIDADEIVPGDTLPLEAGDVVPADLRLIECHDLNADESALTGESLPVAKTTQPLVAQTAPADRRNMVFRGTAVTRGRGVGIAVATGRDTQFGEIVELMAGTKDHETPLEKRLDRLGRQVATGVFALTIAIVVGGTLSGRDIMEMVVTGIALAVAAVPEGLPIVATLALARGMSRMAAQNVLVNRLAAVETLGSTDVLLTDKTGTLTENRMTVARLILADGEVPVPAGPEPAAPPQGPLATALEIAALCNDAEHPGGDAADSGDPMEVALLVAAERLGADPGALRRTRPRIGEVPFDPDLKLMATFHEGAEGSVAAVKGAPEAVLPRSTAILTDAGVRPMRPEDSEHLLDTAQQAAGEGLRLLGLATGTDGTGSDGMPGDLTFVGFIALLDPPRGDVADAVAACRRAGVNVVMVTGDHAGTGRNIARAVNIIDGGEGGVCEAAELEAADREGRRGHLLGCRVFARIPPRAKLDLATLHQNNGSVVAMTGDGVNDAPALKKADVGIAMGQRGTQVAREAADIILRDDRFTSIVEAIREGRIIYGNIRNFVRYLLFCNISEIVILAVGAAAGLPLPLLPLQILYLNLITDVMPALALGVGKGPKDVMIRPPRPAEEPLISRRDWRQIMINTVAISTATLAVFVFALSRGEAATTAAFLTLAFAQLVAVFLLHGKAESLFSSEITRNRYIWLAMVISTIMIAAPFFLDPLATVLGIGSLSAATVLAVGLGSVAPVAAVTALRRLQGEARHGTAAPAA